MKGSNKFQLKRLFEPGLIGKMNLKNRLVMSPMGTGSHGPEGELTQRTARYYAERAKGGVGFIICQSSIIMREARTPFRPSIYDDKFIAGFRHVAQAIHKNGAKAAFQLVHHGRLLADYQREDLRPIAPSAISKLLTTDVPETGQQEPWTRRDIIPPEATQEDIKRITLAFAEAARRVKDAGFDAVEIHGGHGYLISQFLSPLVNRRQDGYGGSLERRARFACEIIEAVRDRVGPEFPILFRLSGSDFLPGGISIEDTQRQAPLFVEAGADALDVSASEQASTDWQYPSYLFPQGVLVPLAEAIKRAVRIPVITVGKIYDPGFAEEVLRQGRADFIALGRALFADPEWPNKAKEGRFDDIRPCVYCLNCFNSAPHHLKHILKFGITCAVNPAVLREKEFALILTSSPKNVMVTGGGPAGMEAARTLAQRGHQVTLYEQSDRLGGQWYIASQQVHKRQDYPRLIDYLKRGLKLAGVEVQMNTRVTPELVRDVKPDVVVLATGATPRTLSLPGIEDEHVVQASDVILGRTKVGNRVIVVGGRYVGMEVALQLAEARKRVSLVTRRDLGRGIERNVYMRLRNMLIEEGVWLYPHSPVVEIKADGLYIIYENDLVFLPADTIVLAVGVKPQKELAEKLKGSVAKVYSIGDCVEPRDVMAAIREAAEVARKI